MEEKFFKAAIKQALIAKKKDEVPVGAVVVCSGKVIAKAHNLIERKQSATSHAELLAINKACKKKKSWRLCDCELYVTLEPCPMCAGAIVNARIKKVYFGAYEKKSGSAESKFKILSESGLNHVTEFEGGIHEKECSEILKDYFKQKRSAKALT